MDDLNMQWFLVGFACGILTTVPLVFLASRRTARRVRRLEQRARRAERLAELGSLTGGLAHEIKNPLSTIGMNLQLLRESLGDAEVPEPHAGRLSRRIEALSSEAERLRDILEDFLRFAGRIRLDLAPTDVNAVVGELTDFYSPQAEASGIHLRTQLSPGLPPVHLDVMLFKQALLNLLINATQAMVEARYSDRPHGGSEDLMIRTEGTRDSICVHVTDTGPGIEKERLRKIFQPYYTSKKGGTGLGLATSRRIIEEHGGTITVHADEGRGADFIITLPLKAPDPDSSLDKEDAADHRGRMLRWWPRRA